MAFMRSLETWLLEAYAQASSLLSNHKTYQAQKLGRTSEKYVPPLPSQAVWTGGDVRGTPPLMWQDASFIAGIVSCPPTESLGSAKSCASTVPFKISTAE